MTDEQYIQANKIINDIQRRKKAKETIFNVEKEIQLNPQNFYRLSMPGYPDALKFSLPAEVLAKTLRDAKDYLDNDIEKLENQFRTI